MAAMTNRKYPLWLKGLVFLAFWTFIGLSFASQFYISSGQFGHGISWRQAVAFSLGDWYVWAVVSLPVIWLARRFPLAGASWKWNLAGHLVFSGLASLVFIVLRAWLGQWQSWMGGQAVPFPEVFQPLLIKTFHFNLLIYWVIVSVVHALDYYAKYMERERLTAALEHDLVQVRLQALHSQLNPHFLFNTLHAIACLMHKNVDTAERMLVRLSDLLRRSLDSSSSHQISLRQELDFLEHYLEIEQTRFGERLQVIKRIDPEVLNGQVPSFVLQPLVENAIRHGIEPHARAGRIELNARKDSEGLQLEVRDNGNGMPTGNKLEEGIGLSNTRARLQHLYPGQHQFKLLNQEGGGLLVQILLPFREHTPSLVETPQD
jgi:two-component system, LytTR family, sensor kinase